MRNNKKKILRNDKSGLKTKDTKKQHQKKMVEISTVKITIFIKIVQGGLYLQLSDSVVQFPVYLLNSYLLPTENVE